jgi:hypothetical protein
MMPSAGTSTWQMLVNSSVMAPGSGSPCPEKVEIARGPENLFRPGHEEHGALEDILFPRFSLA